MKHAARMKTRTKLLASLAVVGCAAAVAGLGTYGTFTSSTSATAGTYTAGTVVLEIGATGAATNRLNIGATGLVPGDTMQRSFVLSNTGNQDMASISLTSVATTSSLLDTDTTNGLQLVVEKCAGTGWVESLLAPYTYTCAGAVTTVLTTGPVVRTTAALSGVDALTAAGSDSLRATITLPSAAPNTMQGLSSTVSFTFTGTQRAATSK